MTINWLLIVVLVILVWNMVSGYRRGLVQMLLRFVSSILAVVVSLVLVTVMGESLRSGSSLYSALETWAQQAVAGLETGNEILDLVLSRQLMGEEIAQQISTAIFNVLLFLVAFIIVRLVLALIGRILDRMTYLPVVGTVNRILGIGAGLAHGVIACWLLFVLLELLGSAGIDLNTQQCIASSQILQTISDTNVIWNALAKFLI